MNKQFLLAYALFLILLTSCADPQRNYLTSTEEIIGVYSSTGGATYARFSEDGTVRFGPSLMLVTHEPLYPPGEYWFEGQQLHLSSKDDPVCDNFSAVYQVEKQANGDLWFFAQEDGCDHRLVVLQGIIDQETGNPSTRWVPVEE